MKTGCCIGKGYFVEVDPQGKLRIFIETEEQFLCISLAEPGLPFFHEPFGKRTVYGPFGDACFFSFFPEEPSEDGIDEISGCFTLFFFHVVYNFIDDMIIRLFHEGDLIKTGP